jgi:hypothetical protein
MKFNDAALPNRQPLRRFVCRSETGGCMQLITFRSFEQDLQKACAEGYRIAEQQILQQIAEVLRPNVLHGVADDQWPPAFVNVLVHHIIAQRKDVQFELQAWKTRARHSMVRGALLVGRTATKHSVRLVIERVAAFHCH